MESLTPTVAAKLAEDVYSVQQESLLSIFLARPEFTKNDNNKIGLKAEVGSRIINTKDGFGICAAGGVGRENDIFLIFRGSTKANNNADWVSNAMIGVEPSKTGFPVHLGFNQVFSSMLADIDTFLLENKQLNGVIHCIGHSLGGAIATLAADWIKSKRNNVVKLYTFGAPRPGLSFFAWLMTTKLGNQNIYRVYHATDPVPMIPLFPFVHPPLPGYGHYIPSTEGILSADAHDRAYYVKNVQLRTWEELKRRSPPYNVEHAIEEWLKSKIPVNPADPKLWQWLNSALTYVLRKVGGALLVGLQGGLTGIVTLADKLAWLLFKGINLAEQAGLLVHNLMRKIMQALSMKVLKTTADLTRFLIRDVLVRLMQRINYEARRAIQAFI